MRSRFAGVLAGCLLLSLTAASAALARDVHVRVEGVQRTLVDESLSSLSHRPVTADGNLSHACAGTSALGALNAATGDFAATWSADFGGYFLDAVRGETHTFTGDKRYWSFWVNHKLAETGLCGYRPRSGDDILLFPDCATQGCTSALPLGVRVPRSAHAGRTFRVRVVNYSADGKAHALRGATVRAGGHRARTDSHGVASLKLGRTGTYAVSATRAGYVRAERESIRIR